MAQLGSKNKGFISTFKDEFKQISWPKREQVFKKTLVVVAISVLLAVVILSFDTIYALVRDYFVK